MSVACAGISHQKIHVSPSDRRCSDLEKTSSIDFLFIRGCDSKRVGEYLQAMRYSMWRAHL